MSNTYSQITIHAVFAVKYKENLIVKSWRDSMHEYIAGILRLEGLKPLATGGWLDHVHILFGMPVTMNISDILRIVKSKSSKWVNEEKKINHKFNWQEGYGGFSVSRDHRDKLIKYIINQEEHHSVRNFKSEYLELLDEYEIEYDPKYLFEFF